MVSLCIFANTSEHLPVYIKYLPQKHFGSSDDSSLGSSSQSEWPINTTIGSRRLFSMISFTSLSASPDDAVTLFSLFSRLEAGRVVFTLPSSAVTFSDFLDKDLLSDFLSVSVISWMVNPNSETITLRANKNLSNRFWPTDWKRRGKLSGSYKLCPDWTSWDSQSKRTTRMCRIYRIWTYWIVCLDCSNRYISV